MAAFHKDLTVEQGVDFLDTLTWFSDVAPTPPTHPVDVTGYTAKLQVRSMRELAPVISLTSGNGLTVNGASGTIAVRFTAAQTAALAPGVYLYDLFMTPAAGVPIAVAEGQVIVLRRMTQ